MLTERKSGVWGAVVASVAALAAIVVAAVIINSSVLPSGQSVSPSGQEHTYDSSTVFTSWELQGGDQTTQNPAHIWYKAGFCDYTITHSCVTNPCEQADISPAQVFENNSGYDDDRIVDSGIGRVDVIAQGSRQIFFSTIDNCTKFVSNMNAQISKQNQDRQKALEPYEGQSEQPQDDSQNSDNDPHKRP